MDATTAMMCDRRPPIPAGTFVTSAPALWRWLDALADGEQLVLAVCTEATRPLWCSPGGRCRRAPRQERTIIAVRFGGRVRLVDPGAPGGPLVDVTCSHELVRYFETAASAFAYVEVSERAGSRNR